MKTESFVIALMLCAQSVFGQTDDQVITGEQLLTTSHTSLLTALRVWVPDYEGDVPVLIDGVRVPASVLQRLSVYDVGEVVYEDDPVELVKRGVNSSAGMLSITTRKAAKGATKVTYRGDVAVDRSIGDDDRGLPTQTGWLHQHQLDVEGGDRSVSYLVSARCVPNSRYVLKGMGDALLGLRAYVDYRSRSLYLHNDMTFDHDTEDQSAAVRYLRANSQGSFEEEKDATLTDRFGAQLDLTDGLVLNGSFSFVRQNLRHDRFLSPTSDWFADAADVRQHGTYHKGTGSTETYEGELQLNFDRQQGRSAWQAQAGTSLYSGVMRTEDYGGMGILSDRMGYISFTLSYDTVASRQAERLYERTWRNWVTAHYEYDNRYAFTAGATLTRTSLLAPGHRNALNWSAKACWHLNRERWLEDAGWDDLSLYYVVGQMGYIPFTYQQYTTMYKNQTGRQYIYNYYLTGSTLQGLSNDELESARITHHQVDLMARRQGVGGYLRYVYEPTRHLLGSVNQPLRTGFIERPASVGSLTMNSVEIGLDATLAKTEALRLTGQAMLSYDGLKTEHIEPVDDVTRGSVTLQAIAGRWQAAVGCGGNDNLGMSSVQASYRVGHLPQWMKELHVGLIANNLVCWHPSDLLLTRQYALSLLLQL